MSNKFIQKCWSCDLCSCYLIFKKWERFLPSVMWVMAFFLFLIGALYCYQKGANELGAAIIGAMGAVLTSSVFTLPQELEKYKQTLTAEKQHQIFTDLGATIREIIKPLNIYEILPEKKLIETQQKLQKDYNLAKKNFFQICTTYRIYFPDSIYKHIRLLFKKDSNLVLLLLKGINAENAKDAHALLFDMQNEIREIESAIKEELNIKYEAVGKYKRTDTKL